MSRTRAIGTRAAINGPSLVAGVLVIASWVAARPAAASTRDQGRAFLSGLTTLTTLASTSPANGEDHLSISPAAPPKVVGETVIATDLPEQASSGAFVRGPTGVAVVGSTAYVATSLQDSIVRIRISRDHWDSKSLSVQEQVVGRHKASGASLGEQDEFGALDLGRTDRLWRHAELYDAGLLFMAYQRDPRKGFIPVFQNLAENDALGQFTTQTGSVIAAVPPAVPGPGHFIGVGLFE